MIKFLSFIGVPAVVIAGSLLFAGTPAPFPDAANDAPLAAAPGKEVAVLAGGCFWGVEAVFDRVKGVTEAVSGYAGGEKKTAHYDEVSTGDTGHAESVRVTFDPSKITYGQLLKVYFSVAHDPTELNRQGPDHGTQYRSSIFYTTEEQKKVAEAYIAQLNAANVFGQKIVTQVVPLKGFYQAEGYHQKYLQGHMQEPYIVYNDLPKLAALKKQYPQMCRR